MCPFLASEIGEYIIVQQREEIVWVNTAEAGCRQTLNGREHTCCYPVSRPTGRRHHFEGGRIVGLCIPARILSSKAPISVDEMSQEIEGALKRIPHAIVIAELEITS